MTIIAQSVGEAFWQAIAAALGEWMGGFIGTIAGVLLAILLYLLAIYLVWGLAWDRIITKAGFKGQPFWSLFSLMVVPALILPLIPEESMHSVEKVIALLLFTEWAGIMLIALLPWPARKATKKRQKTVSSTATRGRV